MIPRSVSPRVYLTRLVRETVTRSSRPAYPGARRRSTERRTNSTRTQRVHAMHMAIENRVPDTGTILRKLQLGCFPRARASLKISRRPSEARKTRERRFAMVQLTMHNRRRELTVDAITRRVNGARRKMRCARRWLHPARFLDPRPAPRESRVRTTLSIVSAVHPHIQRDISFRPSYCWG